MRNIFGQPVNEIHPRKMMEEKKIFIVNLAKGAIGDDAARGQGPRQSWILAAVYFCCPDC